MKFSCLQENLIKGINLTRSVCGKEKGLPILSTILLKSENGLIHISGTNLEIGIHCTIRGMVEEEGVVAIDAKIFYDYISVLPKEKIEFFIDNTFLIIIKCGNYSTKLRGVNPDDFPILPFFKSEQTFTIQGVDIQKALSHTLFSATPYSETRPELHGVYFHFKDKNILSCVSTDTYRLSYFSIPIIKKNTHTLQNIIIPLQTLQELQKIVHTQVSENIEISLNETQIQFTSELGEIVSKQIYGTFPEYEHIVPQQFNTHAILEKEELLKAVRATSLFSKSGLSDVLFTIKPQEGGKGFIEIHSSNTLVGENTVVLEGEVRGGENSITLNYRYILDWLQSIDYKKISLSIVDQNTACLFRPQGVEDQYYLLMPILE